MTCQDDGLWMELLNQDCMADDTSNQCVPEFSTASVPGTRAAFVLQTDPMTHLEDDIYRGLS